MANFGVIWPHFVQEVLSPRWRSFCRIKTVKHAAYNYLRGCTTVSFNSKFICSDTGHVAPTLAPQFCLEKQRLSTAWFLRHSICSLAHGCIYKVLTVSIQCFCSSFEWHHISLSAQLFHVEPSPNSVDFKVPSEKWLKKILSCDIEVILCR